MKNKIFLFVLLLICFLTIVLVGNDCYKLKITFEADNISVLNVEKYLASDLRKNLLKVKEIKDVVIVIKDNYCCAYCKIHPFCFQKAINKIQLRMRSLSELVLDNFKITFDYDFDKKYDTFLVLSSGDMTYQKLGNISDDIENELLDSRFCRKILKLGKQQKATYLYYDDSIFPKYNINLSDVKKIIEQNNVLFGDLKSIYADNSYFNQINASFRNSADISKIAINFKNTNYIQNFGNIFKIVDDIEIPSKYLINYNNDKAIILAISSKNIFLNFKLKQILKKYKKNNLNLDYHILKTSSYRKIFIPLSLNANIDFSYKKARKINELIKENCLYFIGIDCPRISLEFDFFEQDENKIVLFVNKNKFGKIRNILSKNSIYFLTNKKKDIFANSLSELDKRIQANKDWYSYLANKKMTIQYSLNNDLLLRYKISKQDILNSIYASNNGLVCNGYNDLDFDYVKIILKKLDDNNSVFVYSKATNSLIFADILLTKRLNNVFSSFAYKNNQYFTRLYK